MARTFETEENRAAQEKVLQWFEGKGRNIVRTPQYAVVDAYVTNGGVVMNAIEVKCRDKYKNQESPYKISATKIQNCKKLAKLMDIGLHLVVQWKDCMGILTIEQDDEFYTEAGGRPPRDGAANDYEMMCHIPLSKFKLFEKKP